MWNDFEAGRRYAAPLAIVSLIAFGSPPCHAAVSYTGVNLAGAEFGETNLPGNYGLNSDYFYPTTAEINYFVGKGMNTFRVPFRWERMQSTLNAAFNATELSRLDAVVTTATSAGAHVVLDPHNYARYWVGGAPGGTQTVIGTGVVTNAAFADFWTRMANQYKNNDRVIFCLINEPNTMPTEQWRDAAQAAITAIRNTGATNLILVPGNAWTGAHSWTQNWYGTPNGDTMLTITDPGNNFAFDVHQYLDSDSSGTSSTVVSATIGQERLVAFTNWMHSNNRRGFLGEFAVANSKIGTSGSQIGDEAIHNMLNYIENNDDVWLGWMWWAAGPKWGNYMFTLEPTNLGQPTQADRAAMAVLQPHFSVNPSFLPGDYNNDGFVDAADYIVWRDNLDTSNTIPNDETPGSVSQADYVVWQANFGRALASGAGHLVDGLAAVAEPSGGLLICLATLCLGVLRKSGRRSPRATDATVTG